MTPDTADTPAMIESNGMLFPDDPAIMTRQLRTRLIRQTYESSEARALRHFIGDTSSVVELGAGIGYVSTSAVHHCKAAQITCIEANPVLCDYITRVHAANGIANSTVINAVALPGSPPQGLPTTLPFYVTDPFWSSSMQKPRKHPAREIAVPVVSLDRILADTEADALICDIEGGEATLFDEIDLSPVQFVLLELHTNRIKPQGVVNVFENMHRHGFFYHQQVSGVGIVLFKRFRKARPG